MIHQKAFPNVFGIFYGISANYPIFYHIILTVSKYFVDISIGLIPRYVHLANVIPKIRNRYLYNYSWIYFRCCTFGNYVYLWCQFWICRSISTWFIALKQYSGYITKPDQGQFSWSSLYDIRLNYSISSDRSASKTS